MSKAKSKSAWIDEGFNRAVEFHQKGDLQQAEQSYREVLSGAANHAGALHLLGIVMLQTRRQAAGVELIDKALAIRPDFVDALNNLGNALRELKRPEEALLSLDKALALKPAFAEAWSNRGNALQELKRFEEAIASYDKALAIKPDYVDALNNRGAALRSLNRREEALSSYDKALTIKPGFPDALTNRAALLRELGRPAEALESCDRALAIKPNYAKALYNRGRALVKLKRYEDALASYIRALAIKPDYAEAYLHRGAVLRQLRRPAEAVASYDRALAIQPHCAESWCNRGAALQELKRPDEALASYDQALAIHPDYAEALSNRAAALLELRRFDEALANCDEALAIRPDYAMALSNRGNALRALKRPQEALASYDQALAIKPDYAEVFANRANGLLELGRLEEALESYNKALAIKPDYPDCAFNRATLALLLGDFAAGWTDYEKRWDCHKPLSRKLKISLPTWKSETISHKKIIVYEEQGFGDIIQFCRYLKEILVLQAHVTFFVRPSLVKLMETVDQTIRVLSDYPSNENFDYQCPLLSLPIAFGTRLETIPAATPYLSAEPLRVRQWRERLGKEGFKVGIAWRGSQLGTSLGKSFAPADFLGLSQLTNVRLISLQVHDGVDELGDLTEGMKVETLGDDFDAGEDAFLDTAAVMETLDLVISADTSIAHLAGALGKPVWVALKWVPDWRWLMNRSDSPWYPTMRLFRQRISGDWRGVFSDIESALGEVISGRKPSLP